MRFVFAMLCLLLITAGSAFAEAEGGDEKKKGKKKFFYQWTDRNGVVHIADGLGKVPEKFRESARKIESSKAQETAAERQPQEPYLTPDYGREEAEAEKKAEWQNRIAEWKDRLADAQRHYHALARERDELFRAWGSAALAPIENRQRGEQIDEEMRKTQEEIDTAKNMIENVIPEEARKAGVPPGWLRE